jgi:hypothetical protein
VSGSVLSAGTPPTIVTVATLASAAGAGAHFILETSTGTIYWDANGGTSAGAVAFAKIAVGTSLPASDIHIV